MKSYLEMREGGNVERAHIIPHLGSYSVGKHTFDMLLLLVYLHPNPSRELYQAILLHDLSERWTGDVPESAKSSCPGLAGVLKSATRAIDEEAGYLVPLSSEEQDWLHALDKIELWVWCFDQLALGNRNVRRILTRMDDWFAKNQYRLPLQCRLFIEKFEWQRTQETLCDEKT